MSRPITTLFMLMSVDGKISTGSSDELDVNKDYGCDRLAVQSGGTVNGLFLREKLFDFAISLWLRY